MASINLKTPPIYTHEGAIAKHVNPELQLRRSVMTCLLWEDNAYEDGQSIADRIASLIPLVSPEKVAAIAIEARSSMKLRHVPLFIAREMLRHPKHKALVTNTLTEVIQRPDELTEFLAIYWKDKKAPIAAQAKKGLAQAFTKFSAYSLAKYNRDAAIKLRDVLFLCHAKPKDPEQATVFKQLVDGTLPAPDTWEVALSAGKDKKETWERLILEGKLGALAFLRNLRNMAQVGVDENVINHGFERLKTDRVLPFRFIAAARHAPQWEPQIEKAMVKALESHEKLPGRTAIVVDNSGSMYNTKVSARSELDRSDAACALAILLREICEAGSIIGFGSDAAQIPPRRGFALADAIKAGPGGGTNTDHALALAETTKYDRIIVVSDEQSHQSIRKPKGKGYFINVANCKNGIGYGDWVHIDGWSESIVSFIQAYEKESLTF